MHATDTRRLAGTNRTAPIAHARENYKLQKMKKEKIDVAARENKVKKKSMPKKAVVSQS